MATNQILGGGGGGTVGASGHGVITKLDELMNRQYIQPTVYKDVPDYLQLDVRPIRNGFIVRYSTVQGSMYTEVFCADPRVIGDTVMGIVAALEMDKVQP
jgi:hypothetical protein